MADLSTEDEFLGNDEQYEEDPGFYGIGLVVGETGELLLVMANGGLADFHAWRVNDTEASSLALMIQAVMG